MTTHELAKKLLEMPDVSVAIYNDVSGDNELLLPRDVQFHSMATLARTAVEHVTTYTKEPVVLFAIA